MSDQSLLPMSAELEQDGGLTSRAQELWPLAVITLGVILSVMWCAALLWGASFVLDWLGFNPAALSFQDVAPLP